jgi:hypothetical protein
LRQLAQRSGRPKLQRAVGHLLALAEVQGEGISRNACTKRSRSHARA